MKSSPHVQSSREKLDYGNSKRFEFSEISPQNLELHTSLTSDDIIIDRKWHNHKWFNFGITREIHRISNVPNQLITTLSDPIGWKFSKSVSRKIFSKNFMQIQLVILELLHTFYFWNICDITDSRVGICITCISFDWKFDFKFSQINFFEFWLKSLRKILKITISEFWFRSIYQMSHIYDSHAWFYEILI